MMCAFSPKRRGTVIFPKTPILKKAIIASAPAIKSDLCRIARESFFAPSFLLTKGTIKMVNKVLRKKTILPTKEMSAYWPAALGVRKCFARRTSRLKKVIAEIPESKETKKKLYGKAFACRVMVSCVFGFIFKTKKTRANPATTERGIER
jgi:hypothetical protein